MDIVCVKFFIQAFHIGLAFFLFCIGVFLFLKKKSFHRLCFLIGLFFMGAYRHQLFISDIEKAWSLYRNAIFIDLGMMFLFLAFLLSTRGEAGAKRRQVN